MQLGDLCLRFDVWASSNSIVRLDGSGPTGVSRGPTGQARRAGQNGGSSLSTRGSDAVMCPGALLLGLRAD